MCLSTTLDFPVILGGQFASYFISYTLQITRKEHERKIRISCREQIGGK
jgi:hypothetical protein